ncbi:RidA family protein [Nocardioides sp. Iso805N]|uniref:RidA family protein n=1 Tax=Nocardioides sp. Iso805N TaxID=1283287 RepID=UPI0003A2E1DA|nr:RidA family protein [Nocardioides sp. Iso805N]
MTRRSIHVPGLGHGAQPIPLASVVGNLMASGGISGKDPATGTFPEDAAAEVAQAFANMRAIVEAAGGSLDQVVKVTVFVPDRSIREHLNPVWEECFPDPESRPARHTLEVPLVGMRLQLEALAVLA